MRRSEQGERLCDNKNCDLIATHTLVWTGHQYYCAIHAQQALGLANHMGFPTPANTVRTLEPDEIYVGPDNAGEDDDEPEDDD